MFSGHWQGKTGNEVLLSSIPLILSPQFHPIKWLNDSGPSILLCIRSTTKKRTSSIKDVVTGNRQLTRFPDTGDYVINVIDRHNRAGTICHEGRQRQSHQVNSNQTQAWDFLPNLNLRAQPGVEPGWAASSSTFSDFSSAWLWAAASASLALAASTAARSLTWRLARRSLIRPRQVERPPMKRMIKAAKVIQNPKTKINLHVSGHVTMRWDIKTWV